MPGESKNIKTESAAPTTTLKSWMKFFCCCCVPRPSSRSVRPSQLDSKSRVSAIVVSETTPSRTLDPSAQPFFRPLADGEKAPAVYNSHGVLVGYIREGEEIYDTLPSPPGCVSIDYDKNNMQVEHPSQRKN